MKIEFFDIQNYRKLKCSRIYLSDSETLFVGANNSGKTSAIDALIIFLDQKSKKSTSDDDSGILRKFHTTDFTVSNWTSLNCFSDTWLGDGDIKGNVLEDWQPHCPSVDVWLKVDIEEVHLVSHLIPTLQWSGGLLGVRLIYQPKNIEYLMENFIAEFSAAKAAIENLDGSYQASSLQLWPKDLREFLDRKLASSFELRAYILDPEKVCENRPNDEVPQDLRHDHIPLEHYPFNGLFKVDIIEAQRGFSDPYSSVKAGPTGGGSLSSQLNKYYARHLNPSEHPEAEDVAALEAIDLAKKTFDSKLNEAFKNSLDEIKGLGYPGFNDPDILLSSNQDPVDNLAHNATVIFDIKKQLGEINPTVLALPEGYNGLGYKNLIYMIFKLISFRDQWMRKGKASKRRHKDDVIIEPLHIVLIEEPEAHLHAQVQQVFIRKAFEVLRKGVNDKYSTQLVVSSHSSYLAQEVGFERLRYFKRQSADSRLVAPSAKVVDLSEIFGDPKTRSDDVEETAKFVARYLKTTHCDLFFANGIILVEGAAERILVPHFIRNNYDEKEGLNRSYISILEVGGAHAQRLKPLIEALGLPALVITDTDAVIVSEGVDKNGKKYTARKSIKPERGEGYESNSSTLKDWFGLDTSSLDNILDLDFEKKVKGSCRAAYQYEIEVEYSEGDKTKKIAPYTFEDALVLSNIKLFKSLPKSTGMMKKMKEACEEPTLVECSVAMYKSLEDKGKAKMALDLLFDVDPKDLVIPEYVKEGLDWLQAELIHTSQDFIIPVAIASGDKSE